MVFPYVFFPGPGGGRGWAMPRISSAAVVVTAAVPENHDGKNSQNGNLVFQKCPSGLGVYGNGLDLSKGRFWDKNLP